MTNRLLLLGLLALLAKTEGLRTSLQDYPFKMALNSDPSYEVHWEVDLEKEEVRFAVNASSRGWVGFGLSRTGQMIGSDVVIGWQDEKGEFQMQDRYAEATSLPPIDDSQDWKLVNAEVEGGYIVMEVKRDFVTCDERDNDVSTSTTHLVWALNDQLPTSTNGVSIHTHKGSSPVNLLGQPKSREEPQDSGSFTLKTNTTIPATKTTYWCQVVELTLPQEADRYIYKFGPFIPEESKDFVHHMLVYQCPFVSGTPLTSYSDLCDTAPDPVFGCRGAGVIAGWAIGGHDFLYPEGVGLKVGEGSTARYALLEIHYDNPNKREGHRDSSGMRFTYTTQAPTYRAGVMTLGHHVTPNMIVPPQAKSYSVEGICSAQCTEEFIEDQGMNVFGGLLHTHLAGKSLVLHHYRKTESCGGVEELLPIDQNLNYDVDYQQVNLFPYETQVLPGDALVLECGYDTRDRTNVTLGGEGTFDEMCLTFLFYYPYHDLTLCTSMPNGTGTAYTPLQPQLNEGFAEFSTNLTRAFTVKQSDSIHSILKPVQWSDSLREELQQSSLKSKQIQVCVTDFRNGVNPIGVSPPAVKCPYQNQLCSGTSGDKRTTTSFSFYIEVTLGFVAGVLMMSF